jgi:hypothetical protein
MTFISSSKLERFLTLGESGAQLSYAAK